jgi:hypothetical protein
MLSARSCVDELIDFLIGVDVTHEVSLDIEMIEAFCFPSKDVSLILHVGEKMLR